jgi:glutamine synthetase
MGRDRFTGLEIKTLEEIKAQIRENDIEMIRLEYTDLLGVNRGKLMPVHMIDEVLGEGIAFCVAAMAMTFDNDIVPSKFIKDTSEDMKVIGDPSTFSIISHCEKTALILGDLYMNDKPLVQSPRGFLKKIVAEYHALGLDPIAASELEFFVYNKTEDGSISPYANIPSSCYTANKRVDPKRFLYQLTHTFTNMGFNVLYMNHEFFPGQYEYNWKHSNVVRAADESALFKAMSKDVAEANDLMMSFMAKPKEAPGGSGCHFHISLNDLETGKNMCDDPTKEDGIADLLKYFMGGLCKHAMGITPFLAPTVNCYKRYQPDSFAPIFVGWGYDNRTTYIRVPNERGAATRMEVRAASAASNAYLSLASILAAGLDGIKNKIEPPEVVLTDLYHDTSRQTQSLPDSLTASLNELESDAYLKEVAGEELVELFSALKNHEAKAYNKFVTDWEWMTYAFHI